MDRVDLTPNEVASLLGASNYPQAELPGFQRSFRELYRGFADLLRSELTVLIDRDISVEWISTRKLTYGEFVLGARERQPLGRIETQPEFGPVFVHLPSSFVGDLVHFMLGG
ncbi:MAG TPA: hypothetical protein VMX74_10445, partial [Pirellulales bacterium]|nr:hypothetical protein [Pirellulales bacterium]